MKGYIRPHGDNSFEISIHPGYLPFTDFNSSGLDGVFNDSDVDGILSILDAIRRKAAA